MPFTKADAEHINLMVKRGDIEPARALLSALKGESAAAALKRFNERYPVKEETSTPAIEEKTPPSTPTSKPDYVMWAIIASVAALVIAVFAAPTVLNYINRVPIHLEAMCRTKLFDGVDVSYSYGELVKGCEVGVQDALTHHSQEVSYCWDKFGETDKRLADCLEDQDVDISLDARYEISTIHVIAPIRR